MKLVSVCLILALISVSPLFAQPGSPGSPSVFIITVDGLRWQEVFRGMDETVLRSDRYATDTTVLNLYYGGVSLEERRRRLTPFLWHLVAEKGQLYGNRDYDNQVNVSNWYKFSYPGYSELLTGYADRDCIPNTPVPNRRTNVLEFLNRQDGLAGKVAAFTSWNIFPYILHRERSGIVVNSGYEPFSEVLRDEVSNRLDSLQSAVADKGQTRPDHLTFQGAFEYVKRKRPRVLLLAFGEADEFAHHGRYDRYLSSIHSTDSMIAVLWHYVQEDPFYRDNTTFIITTDHGRGRKAATWTDHMFFIGGSREIWMAVIGPHIKALGEIKVPSKIAQKQVAATVASLMGLQFRCEHSVGRAIALPQAKAGTAQDRPLVLGNR